MALSQTHKITLAVAMIAALATILAALLTSSGNGGNIYQRGPDDNACMNSSHCTQNG
jgi:hypothetical protein